MVRGRTFSVAGAKVWNSLSIDVTSAPSYIFVGMDRKHVYFATATTLSDYVGHSSGYHVPPVQ